MCDILTFFFHREEREKEPEWDRTEDDACLLDGSVSDAAAMGRRLQDLLVRASSMATVEAPAS